MGIISGVLGMASQLGSSAIAAKAQRETNLTNKQIADMTNKQSIELMREQTRADQSYNSMSAQMKRAMAAGINPMLLAGSQPTDVSAASVPTLDVPVMQNPYEGFDMGISSGVQAYLQSEQLGNQRKSLDIQDMQNSVSLLATVGDLAKSSDLSSDDINNLIEAFAPKEKSASIAQLAKDNYVVTKLSNGIKQSNLSTKEKEYLYGWLDERTNAEFTKLLADTEATQTLAGLNRERSKTEASIRSLNSAKQKEIFQAIENMQEQWKSLNYQGEFDAKKLQNLTQIFDDFCLKYHSEAGVSKLDFENYVWNRIIDNETSVKVGPVTVKHKNHDAPFPIFPDYAGQTDMSNPYN